MGKKRSEKKKSCGEEDSAESSGRDGGDASEDDWISVHPDKADFDESAATEPVTVSTILTNNHKRKSAIVKLKCTDLDHFAIRPGIAVLNPGETLDVSIERRPHKATRNHKVEVHYVPIRSKSPGDLNKAFKATSPSARNVLSFLLRAPKDKKDEKKKKRSKRQVDPEDETLLGASDRSKKKDESARASRKKGKPPPPLALDDPNAHLFFFPPYDSVMETSIVVRNPSPAKRVAVKMKCSDLAQFEMKPSYCFIDPGAKEKIFVRRKAVPLSASAGRKPELLALQTVEVSAKEKDWARVWKEATKEEVSTTTLELELRSDPFLEAVDAKTHVLFFKPHSTKALAALTLQNLSPFPCLAKCYCGDNEIFRVNPVRSLIEPHGTKNIHFSVAKLPITETKIQVDYTKCDSADLEAIKADTSGKTVGVIVDAAIKGKKEKVMELNGLLKTDEAWALKVVPEAAELRRGEDGKWKASLKLHNLSSAHVALKVKALEPNRYAMTLSKTLLEPGEVRELGVEERVDADGAQQASALRLDFAFSPPCKTPDAALAQANEKDAVAHHRVPINYAAAPKRDDTAPKRDDAAKDD